MNAKLSSVEFSHLFKMVTKFQRPTATKYPQVYHTFMAKDRKSDKLVEYYIQDLTKKDVKKGIQMIAKYLTPEETFQQAINLSKKKYSAEVGKQFFGALLKEEFSIACFKSGSNEMVGLNVLAVKTKGEVEIFGVNDEMT